MVNTTPVADFILPGNVCLPSGPAAFKNTSTVSTGGFSGYLWSFGDGNTSTVKDPNHIYATTGSFTVSLRVTTDSGCQATTTKTFSSIFAKPKADFTAPTEVCLRDTVALRDASLAANQAITRYVWTMGDNTTDTVVNPKKLYTQAGTYQIQHWVITDKGCFSDTALKTVVVNALPVVAFTNTTPACETRQISLSTQSSTAAGTITRWYWSMGDNTIKDQNNGNTITHTYATAGSKIVSLAVSSDKGCKSDTLKKAVMITALPKINFPLPEVCLSDAFAQFIDSSTISDGTAAQFAYVWSFGNPGATPSNPNTAFIKDPRHRYSAAGNYNVQLKITTKDGCVDSLQKVLVVNGDKPKADFTLINGGNICATDALQLKDNSSVNFGSITKVQIFWEWPNASIQTTDDLPVPGKIYSRTLADFISPASKTFQIRYLAFSGGICVDEITKTITVNARPKAVFTTVPGICVDAAPRQITQASNTGVVSGVGAYSGPGVSATGLFTPSVAGVGTHTIRYRFVAASGCIDSANQTITVWPRPTAAFTIDSPTCAAQAITLRDASVPNANKLAKWDWDFGNSTTTTRTSAAPFAQTYTTAGNYTIVLKVTTDSGCASNSTSRVVVVNDLPVVDFDLPTVCLPIGAAQFTDRSTIADGSAAQFSYLWNFGSGNATSTQKNPLFNYSATGAYTVTLRVTSKNGCTVSASKQLTDVNPQPLANFDATPLEVCLGDVINFTDKSNPLTQTIVSYRWAFGDNATSTLQNPNRRYAATGTFRVSLNYSTSKGCISDTVVKSVTVHPYPVVNAGPDQVVLEGGQKLLPATVSGGSSYQYQWQPATYLNNANVLQPISAPKNDVTYTLTVTSLGGCKRSDDIFVKLLLKPQIPNAFSPNGDGINDTWSILYLDSYPGATVQLFDRYGRQVLNSVGYSRAWDGKQNGVVVPA
ncbi:MAG: PKD domain-containing protein [Bacteroidetes bacterium]|nr:MAG: PKD domain-containing protein [Bacteroidota bacterium]